MGPCNSHKCHCTLCTAALKAVEEMTRAAREREQQRHLEQHFADTLRREQWKRRARQHHIDQAGCCTGESECPCLNCREYREFYRLRLGESLHKVHMGHDDRGRMVKWYWVRRPGGWRRKDLKTNRVFGPFVRHVEPSAIWPVTSHHIRTRTVGAASIRDEVIIHTTNPDSASSWVRSMFTDPPAYVSRDQATEFYRAHYGLDSPWADPPRKSDLVTPEVRAAFLHGDWTEKKEAPMLTVLQLAILSHHIVHPGVPYPYTCSPGFGTVSQALADLIAGEFLEPRPEGGYKITHRTTIYFRAINTLPLPIRKPAPWVMPEPQPQPQTQQFGSRER